MSVTPIGAEGLVAALHGDGKAGRDGFLANGQVARAFDEVLQKQLVSALFAIADLDLKPEQLNAPLGADVVVRAALGWRFWGSCRPGWHRAQRTSVALGSLCQMGISARGRK